MKADHTAGHRNGWLLAAGAALVAAVLARLLGDLGLVRALVLALVVFGVVGLWLGRTQTRAGQGDAAPQPRMPQAVVAQDPLARVPEREADDRALPQADVVPQPDDAAPPPVPAAATDVHENVAEPGRVTTQDAAQGHPLAAADAPVEAGAMVLPLQEADAPQDAASTAEPADDDDDEEGDGDEDGSGEGADPQDTAPRRSRKERMAARAARSARRAARSARLAAAAPPPAAVGEPQARAEAGAEAAAQNAGEADAATAAPVNAVAPKALAAARGGAPDALQTIEGIGPVLERLCHEMGIYHFDQIAGWGPAEVAWMDANLKGFKGRVSRDKWVRQAALIGEVGLEEFQRRAKTNDY